jgi:hypothetical protein
MISIDWGLGMHSGTDGKQHPAPVNGFIVLLYARSLFPVFIFLLEVLQAKHMRGSETLPSKCYGDFMASGAKPTQRHVLNGRSRLKRSMISLTEFMHRQSM